MTTEYIFLDAVPLSGVTHPTSLTLSTDSHRQLCIQIEGIKADWVNDNDKQLFVDTERLTEDQIVDAAVRLLGPAFYFTANEDALKQKFIDRMQHFGFYLGFK